MSKVTKSINHMLKSNNYKLIFGTIFVLIIMAGLTTVSFADNPATSSPPVITVVKNTVGGDGTFDFSIDSLQPSKRFLVTLSSSTGASGLYCNQPESYYNVINGTESHDYIEGTIGNDLILGHGGNDFIRGMAGDDCIYGGEGNDFIQGMAGDDTIYGGNGDDIVRTGWGNDTVYGEDGNDILHAVYPWGSNILDGGNGNLDICIPGSSEIILTTINCEITE